MICDDGVIDKFVWPLSHPSLALERVVRYKQAGAHSPWPIRAIVKRLIQGHQSSGLRNWRLVSGLMFEEIELSDPSHHPAPPLVVPLKCFPLEHTCVKKLQLSSKSMLQPLQPGLKQKSEEHHGEWPRQSVGMSVVSASQNNSAREEPCYNLTIGHISGTLYIILHFHCCSPQEPNLRTMTFPKFVIWLHLTSSSWKACIWV